MSYPRLGGLQGGAARWAVLGALLAPAVIWAGGCSNVTDDSGGGGGACRPGVDVQGCLCPNGEVSAAYCNADGATFGQCGRNPAAPLVDNCAPQGAGGVGVGVGAGGTAGTLGVGGSAGSLGVGGAVGMGGSAGVAGTIGMGGTAGAGVGGMGGTGTGSNVLVNNGGLVLNGTNTVGIKGAFFTYADMGGSSIMPADFAGVDGPLCVTGVAGMIMNDDPGTHYGAALGLNLNQEPAGVAAAYDATANGVTGFGFDIDTLPAGGSLRFSVIVAGDTSDYCAEITTAGRNEFRFADLPKNCWVPETATPTATSLEALHWTAVTNATANYNFDFCISNITALQ